MVSSLLQLANQHRNNNTASMSNKYRVSIDLAEEARKELPKLQKKVGALNLIDLFRKALAVLELIVDHQKSGGKVILQDKAGEQEVLRLI